MPIYEYVCMDCNTKFEAIRSFNDADALIECKKCNSKETKRVVSLCYSKSDGQPKSSSSSSGCGSCHGGSCSSCGH